MNNENILLSIKQNSKKPLLLDGAMGSLLQMRGFYLDEHLWASRLNIDQPEEVLKVHAEYLKAGADIITTNTFRTNPTAMNKSNLVITDSEFVHNSVKLTQNACLNAEIIIAGSNAPAEDCYQKERTISYPDLEYNHKKHIELMWESGVDIIWNETHSHMDEINIICKFCNDENIPFVLNLYITPELKIFSGEPVDTVIEYIRSFQPIGVGLNCIPPATFSAFLEKYPIDSIDGMYLNCGKDNFHDEAITCGIKPEEYVSILNKNFTNHLLFVGSCCGSSPFHTNALRNKIDEIYRN